MQLRPRFADGLPRVSVDPEQIRRVMINLIDNAVEAMDRRGVIDVEAHHVRAESLVRVVVADDGPGIPPTERDKLFLPYYSTKRRGQRPWSGHRASDRRRARRQHRRDRQRAARNEVYGGAALLR